MLAQALRLLAPVAAPLGDWVLVIGRGEHPAAERQVSTSKADKPTKP